MQRWKLRWRSLVSVVAHLIIVAQRHLVSSNWSGDMTGRCPASLGIALITLLILEKVSLRISRHLEVSSSWRDRWYDRRLARILAYLSWIILELGPFELRSCESLDARLIGRINPCLWIIILLHDVAKSLKLFFVNFEFLVKLEKPCILHILSQIYNLLLLLDDICLQFFHLFFQRHD